MKVGDLVKLSYGARWGDALDDRVGIIAEWESCSGWVQWAGNYDWDIEYEEDLEVISESR
mgnify:CR=1 FL=1